MEIINKIKEYNKLISGCWITATVFETGRIDLSFKYPQFPWEKIAEFESLQDFLESDCVEVIKSAGFSKVIEGQTS